MTTSTIAWLEIAIRVIDPSRRRPWRSPAPTSC